MFSSCWQIKNHLYLLLFSLWLISLRAHKKAALPPPSFRWRSNYHQSVHFHVLSRSLLSSLSWRTSHFNRLVISSLNIWTLRLYPSVLCEPINTIDIGPTLLLSFAFFPSLLLFSCFLFISVSLRYWSLLLFWGKSILDKLQHLHTRVDPLNTLGESSILVLFF